MTIEQLKSPFWQLSKEEKASATWNEEIIRRVTEIQSGRATGKPAKQVFAELREQYR